MTREEKPGLTTWGKNAKKLKKPEWRNWQTRWTQNPVLGDQGVGSTPSSGTIFPALKSGSASQLIFLVEFSSGEGQFFYRKTSGWVTSQEN